MVTIFANIWSKNPFYKQIDEMLVRIKNGKSKSKIEEIRRCIDKERANELKKHLPSVCFSGKFKADRKNDDLIEHSGYLVLDFDAVENVENKKEVLIKYPFIRAVWVSPSGNGVKALIPIKFKDKHIEHFKALQEIFPEIDKSGVNVSRVCYESWDENLLEKSDFIVFDGLKKEKIIEQKAQPTNDETFDKILKWLANRGDAFRTGERNIFLYKLASACCRFGINEFDCVYFFQKSFITNENDFSITEVNRTIKSAYNANKSLFGSAEFSNEDLVDKTTKKELEFNPEIYDINVKPKDVVYGEDVKDDALKIFLNGYESANSTHVTEIDEIWKWKKGEITLLTGIGNYGKSTFLKYLIMLQICYERKKFAIFSPEDNPPAEFYHDLVEMYCGMNCTPQSINKPTLQSYEAIYDFISKHVFYVYPESIAPTPEYVKERFLELIIKEKISGCIIDPFNQMSNNYGARSDKYLETILSDFSRFAQTNDIYFIIVAHPKVMHKPKDSQNYPEPDVFDIADGAMWNNKMDNILVYHRPNKGEDPASPICTLSSKKVRRQKIVGKPGTITFELSRAVRRFIFNGNDYLGMLQDKNNVRPLEANVEFDKEPF